MGSKKAVLIFSILITTSLFIALYAVLAPAIISRGYENRVHAAVRPLKSNFKALDKSAELPLIIDADAPGKVKTDDAARIFQLIKDGQKQLDALKAAAGSLSILPYSDVLGQYADAVVLKDHVRRFIGQSEDALVDYKALTAYLMTFNEAVDGVSSELRSFNSVVDINEYGGQAEKERQIAAQIRTDAAKLASSARPADMEGLNAAAVVAFEQAASGFDDLAYGLSVPADDPIYAAAREIEGATADLERVDHEMYDESLAQSRIVKNVYDLSDKLDLVLTR
jgi:hypothetical protein